MIAQAPEREARAFDRGFGARLDRHSIIEPVSYATNAMGGRLAIHLDAESGRLAQAKHESVQVADRIGCWAARLTRFSDESELSRLNASTDTEIRVGPTLAAVLRAAMRASLETGGLIDVTMLDARLAAEGLAGNASARNARAHALDDWSIVSDGRASIVRRPAGLRFDLDGIAKGWIADRALDLLSGWSSALIDADGDLAVRAAPGKTWEVAVDDPRVADASLAVLHLTAAPGVAARWGVATSGTSIHRWNRDGRPTHHIIDPRTCRPAATDVVQATVVSTSAVRAEALAKAAVIAGSLPGLALLDRAGAVGAVILTETGETLALPQTLDLLAE